MTICIIPARSGSKRIKNKNIKRFGGKPIISYAIRLAQSSGLFKRIVVSTDSYKISKIARVDFESVTNEKSLKKKSLRGFVTKNRIPLENLNIPEKVRQSLRAGL